MLSANTNALVLPLILVGAGPLAVLFKVYGIVPLAILDRRREVLATIVDPHRHDPDPAVGDLCPELW